MNCFYTVFKFPLFNSVRNQFERQNANLTQPTFVTDPCGALDETQNGEHLSSVKGLLLSN